MNQYNADNISSFNQLPLCEELLLSCQSLNYIVPTPIQAQSLPYTLAGKDIIALAQTGSGKTLAFALPMLQFLLDKPIPYYGLVLAPSRQLVVQIADHFKAIGSKIGLKVAVIIGSMDLKCQVKLLNNNPHIVVGTPGKILYHMQNTRSYKFDNTQCLVLDEADKLLSEDFSNQLDKIIQALPNTRKTYLFSATMTNKVEKLQRAALKDPVKISVNEKYQTVKNLKQYYIFIPAKMKQIYLVYILQQRIGKQTIIFTLTCMNALKICLLLRKMGFKVVTINGQISQNNRLASLNRFKQHQSNILVATDVASRGLDIPDVDLVINYDLPMSPKDYVHRVGRTARAGKTGKSISFVTQYDIEQIQKIQFLIGKQLELYESNNQIQINREIEALENVVMEKLRITNQELKLKLEKQQLTQDIHSLKYSKLAKKIQKKKLKNKKKRTLIDI